MRLAAFEIGRSNCTALQCVAVMQSVRREIDAFCERAGEENIVMQQSRFLEALSAARRARGTRESSTAAPDAATPDAAAPDAAAPDAAPTDAAPTDAARHTAPPMMRSVRAGLVPVYEEARELVEHLCTERWKAAPLPRLSIW
jgi:hypothetical protein